MKNAPPVYLLALPVLWVVTAITLYNYPDLPLNQAIGLGMLYGSGTASTITVVVLMYLFE